MPNYSVVLSDGERETELVGGPDGLYLTDLAPPVLARENVYAQGADSRGRRRVRTKPQNGEGSGRVRVDWSAGDDVDLYEDLDDFQDLVESAHRNKGWLRMTPEDGEAVTFDLQSIAITEFPHDAALIADRRAEIAFEYECLPYGRLASVDIFDGETLEGPIDSIEIDLSTLTAHHDLLGVLTLTDASSQSSDHVEVGVEQYGYDPDDPSDFLIDSDALVTSGFAGSGNTRTGAYDVGGGNTVVRATLTSTQRVVCGTGALPHYGLKKIRARVWPTATDVVVRLLWRVGGDGPLREEKWVAVPGEDDFFDLDLATIDIALTPEGTHSWEGQIEAKCGSGVPTLDVDLLEVIPAEVYSRAAGGIFASAATGGLVAADDFANTSYTGDLSGETPPLSTGNWSGAGDATDFQCAPTYGNLTRVAVSDVDLNTGRYARCGTGVESVVTVQGDVYLPPLGTTNIATRFGVFLRYVDTSNWLMAVYVYGGDGGLWDLYLYKRVAGTVTQLGVGGRLTRSGWYTIVAGADAAGNVLVYDGPQNGTLTPRILVFADSDLATSGALEDGGYGFYDAYTSATALTRYYDNFSASVPVGVEETINHALNADASMRFESDKCIREQAGGGTYAKVADHRGAHFTIPPATFAGKKARLVVKRRRYNNDDGFADEGLEDDLTASLSVTPLVALTGG